MSVLSKAFPTMSECTVDNQSNEDSLLELVVGSTNIIYSMPQKTFLEILGANNEVVVFAVIALIYQCSWKNDVKII